MEEKVMRQLNRALKPAFTELRAEWGDAGGIIQQTPYRFPPLFAGSRLVLYGTFFFFYFFLRT
jgi:hypothetical protein